MHSDTKATQNWTKWKATQKKVEKSMRRQKCGLSIRLNVNKLFSCFCNFCENIFQDVSKKVSDAHAHLGLAVFQAPNSVEAV